MDSANVTFTIGGNTLTIAGPIYDNQPVVGPANFVSSKAADGTAYSYKLNSSAWRSWRMNFLLSQTEFAALETFYYTVAKGPTNSFTFVSTSGDSYTGRFVDLYLQSSRSGPALRSVQLTIEVSGVVK